jgi:Ni,Fe-hydrogenase III component G
MNSIDHGEADPKKDQEAKPMESRNRVVESLRRTFPEAILGTAVPVPKVIYLTIQPSFISKACDHLFGQGARFVISVATDLLAQSNRLEVSHIFSFDEDCVTVVIRSEANPTNPSLDSISPAISAANWAERECRDLLGVDFIGHPDPRRLALADDWPKGVHPLRRDFPYNYKPPAAPENAVPLNPPPPHASVFPIGPFYPVLEEPAYFRVFVEGEEIVGCDYRGFYNHRGIEKLADSALTYNQVVFLAERICGI